MSPGKVREGENMGNLILAAFFVAPLVVPVVYFIITKEMNWYFLVMGVWCILSFVLLLTKASQLKGWQPLLLFVPHIMLFGPIVFLLVESSRPVPLTPEERERKRREWEQERQQKQQQEQLRREMYDNDQTCYGCTHRTVLGGCRKGTQPIFGQCVNRS